MLRNSIDPHNPENQQYLSVSSSSAVFLSHAQKVAVNSRCSLDDRCAHDTMVSTLSRGIDTRTNSRARIFVRADRENTQQIVVNLSKRARVPECRWPAYSVVANAQGTVTLHSLYRPGIPDNILLRYSSRFVPSPPSDASARGGSSVDDQPRPSRAMGGDLRWKHPGRSGTFYPRCFRVQKPGPPDSSTEVKMKIAKFLSSRTWIMFRTHRQAPRLYLGCEAEHDYRLLISPTSIQARLRGSRRPALLRSRCGPHPGPIGVYAASTTSTSIAKSATCNTDVKYKLQGLAAVVRLSLPEVDGSAWTGGEIQQLKGSLVRRNELSTNEIRLRGLRGLEFRFRISIFPTSR